MKISILIQKLTIVLNKFKSSIPFYNYHKIYNIINLYNISILTMLLI